MIKKELYDQIILFIGDAELIYRPYFSVDEINLKDYSTQEIYDHIVLMIEGEILDGFYTEDIESNTSSYLIGGLTTETKYYYFQLKKNLQSSNH